MKMGFSSNEHQQRASKLFQSKLEPDGLYLGDILNTTTAWHTADRTSVVRQTEVHHAAEGRS